MLLGCKVENKGMFTVVLKRRFYGFGIVTAVFTLEHSNSDGKDEWKRKRNFYGFFFRKNKFSKKKAHLNYFRCVTDCH